MVGEANPLRQMILEDKAERSLRPYTLNLGPDFAAESEVVDLFEQDIKLVSHR